MLIDGIDEMLARLQTLADKGEKAEKSALERAGDVVKDAIVSEAPRRTGLLRERIRRTNVRDKKGLKYVQVSPGRSLRIARFLEYGTVHMKANPFMSRGYEHAKQEAYNEILETLREAFRL